MVDQTAISHVMPEINALTYRGYPVQDLARHRTFEDVAYLLWHGNLPTPKQRDAFTAMERSLRNLSPSLLAAIRLFPADSHPMDTLRTAVSFLGMEQQDTDFGDPEGNHRNALDLLAKIPTIIATSARIRKGLAPIPPRTDLPIAENFFHMCFGRIPEPDVVKAFDVSLTLYAEHGFNASTFTARVVTSTMSDLVSAVVAGIGSLKGPLHGGANEAVMRMLLEIDDPSRALDWMKDALDRRQKLMGFGHRVYKGGDSRVPTMMEWGRRVAHAKGETKWHDIADILAEGMVRERGLHPNLDLPSGPAYYLMGFDIDLFTPIFVMARVTGWCAHVFEQSANNRLIRPLSAYVGVGRREVRTSVTATAGENETRRQWSRRMGDSSFSASLASRSRTTSKNPMRKGARPRSV